MRLRRKKQKDVSRIF